MALLALVPQKSVSQDPATKVLVKLLNHEVRKTVPGLLSELLKKTGKIFLNDFVKNGLFGFMALIVVLLFEKCGWHGAFTLQSVPFAEAILLGSMH